MLEVTKAPTTAGRVNLSIHGEVPESVAAVVEAAVQNALEENRTYSTEEVLGPITPGQVLQGARYREGLTQVGLAKALGVSKQYVSDMEHGRRAISPTMAKRLGAILGIGYKVFL